MQPFSTAQQARDYNSPHYITGNTLDAVSGDVDGAEVEALPQMGGANAQGALVRSLTPRQCEVLSLVRDGLTSKLIGRRLGMTEHTVKTHLKAIFRVLRVGSRIEAAAWARVHLPEEG